MISSEVQRTLVKSPPELWTELSDPESLARHLGELGEIRITRTEPENLVEWEAEGTTGTVEIAPSGWGTRVTLTVLRELPAGDGAADAELEATVADTEQAEPEASGETPEPGASATGVAGSEADAGPEAEVAPATDAAPATQAAPEAAGAAETELAPETEAMPEAEAIAAVPPSEEARPAPATEAARRAAGWPSTPHSPGPAIESDLRVAEELDGSAPEPDALQEWASQAAAAEPEPNDRQEPEDEAQAEPEPPRRGLFARLFGRRREPAKRKRPPAEASDDLDTTDRQLDVDLGEAEDAGTETTDNQLVETDTDGPVAAAEEASITPPGEESGIGHGDLAALGSPEPSADDLAAEEMSELETEEPDLEALGEPETEHADPEGLGEPETDDSEIATEAPGVTTEGEPAGMAAQAEAHDPQAENAPAAAAPVADLAAELRAAEEVAAEQVEAVLTGVLDRLGSAHHRPFSRS